MCSVVALQEQLAASATAIGSTVGDSSPLDKMLLTVKTEEKFEPLGLHFRHYHWEDELGSPDLNLPLMEADVLLEDGVKKVCPCFEHQFIPSFSEATPPPPHENAEQARAVPDNLSALKHGTDEEEDDGAAAISLQLGDCEPKKMWFDPSSNTGETK